MKTSYFGSRQWHGLNAVSIARGEPKWYRGRSYKDLAPPWYMIKIKDEEEYTKQYNEKILGRLSPEKVVRDLGEDAILLCWERPGEFCHRRLVAEWLEEELGIKVPELGEEYKQISFLSRF